MGTLTGQQLVDRALVTLQDANAVRWKAAESLMWINDAQREVCIYLPSAYTKTAIPALVAGTKQTASGLSLTDCVQILKVPRNFASNGTTVGRAITVRPMPWMDEQFPTWHSDTAGELIHAFVDAADPKTFYHWPHAVAGNRAEVVYAAVPPELAALSDVISLDDVYANAMQYYLLFRAFGINSTFTKSPQSSATYYSLFLQALGIKDQRRRAADPNLQMQGDGAGVAGPGGAS